MSWKRERDSLIAQTMAFVQSVTGSKEASGRLNGAFAPANELQVSPELDLAPQPAPRLQKSVAPIEPVRISEPPPAVIGPAPRPIVPSEVASEIRARVASFRAHQERFNREREQYFSATLQRLRAAIDEANQPRIGK